MRGLLAFAYTRRGGNDWLCRLCRLWLWYLSERKYDECGNIFDRGASPRIGDLWID